MALKRFVFVLLLILTGLGLFVALPPIGAQDGTPPPNGGVVNLPFGDTFETDAGWLPTGTWRYDAETGFESQGSWYADGSPRMTSSTLEYAALINLSGGQSPQLIYRQKGSLPDSDLIAVDISVDGGASWLMVDQQLGIETDWEQHPVYLAAYQGQIIRLRFRLDTGAQVQEGVPVVGNYWIDNVFIQFTVAPTPTPDYPIVIDPKDLVPRTMMGLHLTMGVQSDLVIGLVKRMKEAGRPLGVLKGTTDTEKILNEVAEISPETTLIYRSLMAGGRMTDCPDSSVAPEIEARNWLNALAPYWDLVDADYYELMNECQFSMEWLIPFTIESMRLANEQGRCLLVLSFSTGTPQDPSVYAQLVPVYDYALRHPCPAGRYHGIALHAYGVEYGGTLVSESGRWLGYRYRELYNYLLPLLPEAVRIPVYLTEAGPGVHRFPCTDVARDVIQYTRGLETDSYIRGFALWNFGGTGGGGYDNYSACLPQIGDALVNYYAASP